MLILDGSLLEASNREKIIIASLLEYAVPLSAASLTSFTGFKVSLNKSLPGVSIAGRGALHNTRRSSSAEIEAAMEQQL